MPDEDEGPPSLREAPDADVAKPDRVVVVLEHDASGLGGEVFGFAKLALLESLSPRGGGLIDVDDEAAVEVVPEARTFCEDPAFVVFSDRFGFLALIRWDDFVKRSR